MESYKPKSPVAYPLCVAYDNYYA
eukprot:COSAG06_NODE_21677_length_749_cov_0.815385_1_plen_23_part_10